MKKLMEKKKKFVDTTDWNEKKKLLDETKDLDFDGLVKDVEQFLFAPGDAKKITLFREYIEQVNS